MSPPRQQERARTPGAASSSKEPPLQRTASVPAAAGATLTKLDFTSPKAEMLYELLESQSSSISQTYTQADLLALPVATSVQELMPLCQELVNLGLFQLLTLDGNVCYRIKSQFDASKVKLLDSDARIIYNTIEAAGTVGIWTKTLKGRTNLHQTVLTRALKMLENKNYVKQVRNAKYPGRKIFMLKNLTPTDEVTGGPWYTDGELDQDLVQVVSDVILAYVEGKSWRPGPKVKKPSASSTSFSRHAHSTHHMISVHDRILLPHPPGYTGYPVASEILTFIDSNNLVSGKDIELTDLQTLLDILVFDRKLEVVGNTATTRTKRRPSKPSASHHHVRRKAPVSNPNKLPTIRGGGRRIIDEDDEDNDDAATATRRPAQKRRRIYGLRGTPSPERHPSTPPSSDASDSDNDPQAQPGQHEPMYRTVRHVGYAAPLTYGKPHDHAAAAPPPAIDDAETAAAATAADDTASAAAVAAATAAAKHKSLAAAGDKAAAAVKTLRTAFGETPCARCPVFRLCEEGGPVDARSCGYFGGWLAGGDVEEVDFTTGAVRRSGGAVNGSMAAVSVVVEVEGQAAAGGAVGVA